MGGGKEMGGGLKVSEPEGRTGSGEITLVTMTTTAMTIMHVLIVLIIL